MHLLFFLAFVCASNLSLPKKEIENDMRQRAVQAAMAGHKCMMAGKFSDALESFTYAVNIEHSSTF
jgi:hypothetical protein